MLFDTVRVVKKHHSMFGLTAANSDHVVIAMCLASFVGALAAVMQRSSDESTGAEDAVALGMGLVAWIATFIVAMVVLSAL